MENKETGFKVSTTLRRLRRILVCCVHRVVWNCPLKASSAFTRMDEIFDLQ